MNRKRNRKKITALMLAAVMATSMLTGCGGSSSSKSTKENSAKDTMTIAVTSFADTLEPTEQYFSWVLTRYGVGETLVKFNQNGELEACLATDWKNSEDGLGWTFTIREGVKFSHGEELTPELVKASLERTFRLSDRAVSFFEPESIEAEGQNLIIRTKKPVALLPGSLADPLFLILDTNVDESTYATEGPVCTGPYAVKSFDPTASCVVVRNEYYWDGQVPFKQVELKCVDDQMTRSMALQSGEVQIAYNLKTENLPDFEGNDQFEIQSLKSLRSTFAFMNQNGVLKDKVLRQAIIRALDKETYCTSLLDGGATHGKAPVPPTLDFGFDELVDENAYDVESARKLLQDNGYVDTDGDGYVEQPNGEKLSLDFVIYTSREELNIYAQALQASVKEIGIRVDLNVVSYETLLDKRDSSDFDLLIWNVLVANTGDPEKYLRENWYSTSSSNQMGYKNEKVDALLDKLEEEFDTEARKELVIQIQQEIMNDAATVFFGYETTYLISSKQLAGVTMYPMDYYWLTKDIKYAE